MSSGNIIDQVVSSTLNFIDADIHVAARHDDFIKGTDHRAVVATIDYGLFQDEGIRPVCGPSNAAQKSSNTPRIKVPLKKDKEKYHQFQEEVDRMISAKSDTLNKKITDDDSFLERYQNLTEIITESAVKIFGRSKSFQWRQEEVTNTKIEEITNMMKAIGGAIRLEKSELTVHVSLKAERLHMSLHQVYIRNSADSNSRPGVHDMPISYLVFLQRKRRALYKDLYTEQSREIIDRAKKADWRKIVDALMGNSTKKLFAKSFIPFPLIVNDLDIPTKLVGNPEGVKSTTRKYFEKLYDHSKTPDMPKPWMSTPSVVEVKDCVQADPFIWPREASVSDFRAMIQRGNARPSPGPDG